MAFAHTHTYTHQSMHTNQVLTAYCKHTSTYIATHLPRSVPPTDNETRARKHEEID